MASVESEPPRHPHSAQHETPPRRGTLAAIDAGLGAVFRWANLVGVFMILGMMFLTATDVALRYFFSAPITGTVEMVEFLLVITIFFGLAHTQRTGGNISMDILVGNLPPRVQAFIEGLTGLLALAVYGAMAYAVFESVYGPGGFLETSDMLEIPLWPFKLLAGAGVTLLSLELVASVVRRFAVALGITGFRA